MPKRHNLPALIKATLPLLKRQLMTGAIEIASVPGEVPVIEVGFPGERLPIYVTDTGSQLLCISYLWRDVCVRACTAS
ncbi:YjfI family protein [Paucibacter sp. O1-1]|nr:YjfI family protein [Paucibacter sp. O1-1]MDA3831325.1 YjfI family protein [Paucibacter sp. O1-1]